MKRQANELGQIEKTYPGITSLKKDNDNNLVIPEIYNTGKELSEIVSEIVSQSEPDENPG